MKSIFMRDALTKDFIYKVNQYQVQKFSDSYYKLIYFKKPVRSKGFENPTQKGKKGTKNTQKLDNNVRRAKNRIFELAMCNDWDLFCTFTIDGKKHPRNDLNGFYKQFAKWLNNYSYRKNLKISYLFIPELHYDGVNWHFHGLISGLPEELLSDFVEGVHPQKLIGKGFKNWVDYEKKFGFCSFDKIRDKERVSKYITKYITKDLDRCVTELGAYMYYASHGLKGREVVESGTYKNLNDIKFDYENEYVGVKITNTFKPFETVERLEEVANDEFKLFDTGIFDNTGNEGEYTENDRLLHKKSQAIFRLCRGYRFKRYYV